LSVVNLLQSGNQKGGVMIILLLLVLGLILWYSGILSHRADGGLLPSMPHQHGTRPIEVAKERYARGEIDREEYDTLRRDLVD
jgi:putative membrane protein